MARRRRAVRREIQEDALYGNKVVAQLIHAVMKSGKKSVASRIVYGAIEKANQGNQAGDPLEVLFKAIENVKPRIEVKSRRVGGATYQVPMEVPIHRQLALAFRWMTQNADKRKGKPMIDALADEIKQCASGQGESVKKRDDVHRMAQANRAFAHLRW